MYPNLGNTNILMYNFFGNLSFIILIIYNLLQYKEKKIFLSTTAKNLHHYCLKRPFIWIYKKLSNIFIWIIMEIIIFSIFQHIPILFLAPYFGKLLSTGTNYFGYLFFIPFILFFLCIIIKIDPLKQLDLVTPAFSITLCFSKLGCFCAGCCNGIAYTNGLYNHETNLYEFPVQLVESVIALLIFFFLLFIKDRIKTGTMYPIYLICYSTTRFFSEFMRHEDNIIGSLKLYHILCIIGLILGVIEFIFISKYTKVIQLYFDEKWKVPAKKR